MNIRKFGKAGASYLTGGLALVIIVSVAIKALYLAATKPEILEQMAAGVLNGTGIAIGSLIGGAIVLRFKTARKFLRRILKEENDTE